MTPNIALLGNRGYWRVAIGASTRSYEAEQLTASSRI